MEEDKQKVLEMSEAVYGENVKLKIKAIIRLGAKQANSEAVDEKPRLMLVQDWYRGIANWTNRDMWGVPLPCGHG